MAIEITHETLKEIADDLDMGMVCFYNNKTGEVESYPDELKLEDFDEEEWADVIDKVKRNKRDYIRFESMHSSEAFKVMERFVGGIDDIITRAKFIEAISLKKPFRQFDELLFHYLNLREQWFAYKLDAYILFVKRQVP